jgi:hypothetical protein
MVTLLDASPETLKRPLAGADTEPMNELPPEDQPDVVWVGPVGPIPIHYEDDPRFEEERAAWSHARRKAQALHSAEELLGGVVDDDWRVRCESIVRLAAPLARRSADPSGAPGSGGARFRVAGSVRGDDASCGL